MKFHSKEDAVRFCNKVSTIGYIAAGLGFTALMGGALSGSDFGGFVAFLGAVALSFGIPTGIVFAVSARGIEHAVEDN
jgi:hypothetical protein